jgi:hypothetical protein
MNSLHLRIGMARRAVLSIGLAGIFAGFHATPKRRFRFSVSLPGREQHRVIVDAP